MFNLKKKSIIMILIVFALLIIGVTRVDAKVYSDEAVLRVDADGYGTKYLYDATGTYKIGTMPGASYDLDTNTLTLNGFNGKYISAYEMDADFKINVIGENTITFDLNEMGMEITLGTVTIIGDGTLNFVEKYSTSVLPSNEGTILGRGSSIRINGPKININSYNGGIIANADVYIKNGELNINTKGDYGIHSSSNINIIDSKVTCVSSKYGLSALENIYIDGKSKVTVKTTLDEKEAITLYADEGKIILTTEESVILEKASNGEFCSPEIAIESETLDTLYKYDIINETNKRTYKINDITKKTLLDFVEIDGTSIIPVIGEEPKYLTLDSDKYEIIEQYWIDEDGKSITKFEEGKEYSYGITLKPKTNYYFSNVTEAKISGMNETDCLYRDEETAAIEEEIRKYKNI